jgi:hypothetical protein
MHVWPELVRNMYTAEGAQECAGCRRALAAHGRSRARDMPVTRRERTSK